MASRRNNLTDDELADMSAIVQVTINKLVAYADKHNFDRDSVMRTFAQMFKLMTEISTFKHYGETEKGVE